MDHVEGTMGRMPKRIMPSFTLTEQDLPVIKNWKVGKKYTLSVEVEQVSMEKDEYMMGKPLMARFRIVEVKEGSKYSKEEKEGRKGY